MRFILLSIFAVASAGCQPPVDLAPADACKTEHKGMAIRVGGKLSYGGSYICKPDFGKSYCSAGFTDMNGENHMYVNVPEGKGPNEIDVRNKDRENATLFDKDGKLVKPGEPVFIAGMVDTVVEYQGKLVCTVKVWEIEKQ